MLQTLTLIAALAHTTGRAEAARALALHLGAEDLLIFIEDPEIHVLLPAPGFQQTLPQGRLWHAFLDRCLEASVHEALLPFPDHTTLRPSTGFANGKGIVLVLLGGTRLNDEVPILTTLLPILEVTFRGEQAILTAQAARDIAQQNAQEARTLATTLDTTRSELQSLLAETNTIIEAIPDALFVCDRTGIIVRSNAIGTSFLNTASGQGHEHALASSTFQLNYLDGNPVPHEEHPLIQALRGITRTDYRLKLHKNDTDIPLLISSAPIRNSMNEITGGVAAATDITELYQLERQKDDFLGIASHELRTPLTALKGLTQVTRHRLERAGLEEVKYVALMEKSIMRMERLIKDFLDVSLIEAKQLAFRLEYCNLAELCEQVVEEQRMISNRTILLDVPHEQVMVMIDLSRIHQVLINLVSNALKYSLPDSAVTLTLAKNAEKVTVAVYDEGAGIPPEARLHLFERFYRVPGISVSSGSEMGFGLGLYICKTIIDQHGGHIGVDSLPGHGSTFWFNLPIAV